jgi:hypothetical protein
MAYLQHLIKPPPTPMPIEYLLHHMKTSADAFIRAGNADIAFSIVLSQNILAASSQNLLKKRKILEILRDHVGLQVRNGKNSEHFLESSIFLKCGLVFSWLNISLSLSLCRDQTTQDKTRQDKTRQDKTGKTRLDKTRRDKTRGHKTRQGKTRQDKTRLDKTRQD